MRLNLYGGFGEKGRTCVGVESNGYRILLDAGVKTSAHGRDEYYPAIPGSVLQSSAALILTHGHEDHAAALPWCIAGGFKGRILMTPETQRELATMLPGYAAVEHLGCLERTAFEVLPVGHDALRLGPLSISTGRSGHVAGGLWCRVADGRESFLYCGDIAPQSPVFAMDSPLSARAIALDASYGADDVPAQTRASEITRWVESHSDGCVLPTPLYGRSAELLAVIPGGLALAPGMREALGAQIEDDGWLIDGVAGMLAERLTSAADWRPGARLPRAALLCHDGMGMSGPSRELLAKARSDGHAVLFTGHLPEGSPGAAMAIEGSADWIRLPTHPTLAQNRALAAACEATLVLGHSCTRDTLEQLEPYIPALRAHFKTGDAVDL